MILQRRMRRLIVAASLALAGCSDKSTIPDNDGMASTIFDKLYDVTAASIRSINYFPEITPLVQHDVSVYRLTYATTYQSRSVTVTGAIAIPVDITNPAIIVDCHGTLQGNDNAPSQSAATKPLRFAQIAATGYIVFAPDYVGFGGSSENLHPWLIADTGAQTVLDMVVEGKRALDENEIVYRDSLFLMGYSEGANFVLSTQREMESDPMLTNTLVASAPSSGVYDMATTFNRRITGSTPENAVAVAYLVIAMRDAYGWSNPLVDFFREPYATQLQTLLDTPGSFETKFFNTQNQLLAELVSGTLDHDSLFTAAFLNDSSSPSRTLFDGRVAANNVYAWRPTAPITLYYGEADTTSYFENAITAHGAFLANGADSQTIRKVGFTGKNHEGAHGPSMKATLDWFATFR